MADFRYLLDSNSISDLIRHPGGRVARRFAVVGEPVVCTSIVVACELRFGAAKKGSSDLSQRIDQMLASLNVLPLDREADRHYAEIRTHLGRKGIPIGSNDLLIAAHTLALDLILVTDNVDEFARVPGLSFENWLAG
jgi:tRNA(fMet)-specific endonuclease VapC